MAVMYQSLFTLVLPSFGTNLIPFIMYAKPLSALIQTLFLMNFFLRCYILSVLPFRHIANQNIQETFRSLTSVMLLSKNSARSAPFTIHYPDYQDSHFITLFKLNFCRSILANQSVPLCCSWEEVGSSKENFSVKF